MVDYSKQMRITYYQSKELEIEEDTPAGKVFHIYFRNISELADLTRTSPFFVEELKPLLYPKGKRTARKSP